MRLRLIWLLGTALIAGPSETMVVLDGRTGKLTVENPARAGTRLTPCSTFKIPNSMIALESGVASDPSYTLQYNPKRDGEQAAVWARDHSLRSALQTSALWYYKEIARRVGPAGMQHFLNRFDYGNRDMSGGIDRFWVGGGLRISAEEQVRFLKRLREGKLAKSSSAVKDMMLLEATPGYRWYGKTGTCTDAEQGPVAWHVGFIERGGNARYYAWNLGGASVAEVFERRAKLLREKLSKLGLIDLEAQTELLPAPEKTVKLRAEMDHVQGIEVDGNRLFVTWVDRKQKTGHLGEFELATGKLLRSVPLHKGERYHPGGLAADGDSLWIPVAEYKRSSSASIQRRSKKTLELESEFEVPDHIGCVAAGEGKIYGGNWDARQIYVWDRLGKLIYQKDNAGGTAFQDLKYIDGHLIGSGLRAGGGAIEWLQASDFRLVRRMLAGKTSRGVVITHEGMAISGSRLYLLPEDAPSRLFIVPLPW